MRIVIIGDERSTPSGLQRKLEALPQQPSIVAVLHTVSEAIDFLSGGGQAELIFSDIHLDDGLSFSIFEQCPSDIPVVFLANFESMLVNVFEHNGIDYLLKPVDDEELARALEKYESLENHFLRRSRMERSFPRKKERLVVRRGFTNVLLRISDIVLFFTENKIVYALDRDGGRYFVDHTLSDLEQLITEPDFFRANRQYLLNVNYISSYRTIDKVKLSVDVCCGPLKQLVVVSQETAPLFRQWISEK